MNLGSDVTTYYAFNEAMDSDLTTEMFNTYIHTIQEVQKWLEDYQLVLFVILLYLV